MSRPSIDISGSTYGDLFVICRDYKTDHNEWYYKCKCICGVVYSVRVDHLKRGAVKRCMVCSRKLRRVSNPKSGYPAQFSLRLRSYIRLRDNHTCQYCQKKCGTGELDVHHIDHDRTNNSKSNLISLCNDCHYMCHHKDSAKWVEYWQDYMKAR